MQTLKSVGRAVLIGLLLFQSAGAHEPSISTRIIQERSQAAADQVAGESATQTAPHGAAAGSTDRTKDFVRAILGDSEDVWDKLFAAMGGRKYPQPKVVLAHRSIHSACGNIAVSSGPFYCAADQHIYLDVAFVDETIARSGDFAAAYLIVREVSHHVQSVLGTVSQLDAVNKAQGQQAARIRLEQQADCFVGVWTVSVQKRGAVDPREVERGAAAAVETGTDQTHREYIAQRLLGFKQGLATGDPKSCDLSTLAALAQRR
jgi:predicted metalloprotease